MPSACCCTVSPTTWSTYSPAVASVDALCANRNSAHSVVQDRCAHSPNSSLYPHSPGQRLALSRTLSCRLALRLLLVHRTARQSILGRTRRSCLKKQFLSSKK